MITIEIKKDTSYPLMDIVDSITISGHAKYAEHGKDIVCAAVSSMVITTVNGILSLDNEALEFNQGEKLEIKVLKHNDTTDKLIKNMINLLEELKIQYSKNIKII